MPLPTKQEIMDTLVNIHDPEIRIGIVDLGLIYDVDVNDKGAVKVKMTLTTPACPYGEMLVSQVHNEVAAMAWVTNMEVVLVWDPPWNPETMASDNAKDILGIW